MRRDGFTLIEVLAACALLTAALAMLWGAWLHANDTAEALDRKSSATDTTVYALGRITRELRAASRVSLSELPAAELTYRVPEDLDDNGLPVDAKGDPEWGAPRRIGRDHNDANRDGLAAHQVVLEQAAKVQVLANGLIEDGPGADAHGLWFEARDGGILVTLRVSERTRRNREIPAVAAQLIMPRNP